MGGVDMVTIPTAAGRDPLDWPQWSGCCWLLQISCVLPKIHAGKCSFITFHCLLKWCLTLLSLQSAKADLQPSENENVSFHLSGAFLGYNSPDCSLWRGIERASLAAVSARHLHKPTSLPPYPSTTAQAALFCKTLQVRQTHKKCQSTAGKQWNPGVPS